MENINHYEVLGVDKNASPKEIKSAYRVLAMKYHPDVSNEPDCARKFREVTEAYEILSDPQKRKYYDMNYTTRDIGGNQGANLENIIIDLINHLNAPESYVRNAAVDELVKIGSDAFKYLVQASVAPDPVIRRKICDVLGKLGDPRGVDILVRLLNDNDSYVRRRAANALIFMGDSNAVVPLINSLSDSESRVRERAAEALGNIEDMRSVDPLIHALLDSDSTVRNNAKNSLHKIGWNPTDDATSARYWINLREWDNCIKIGKNAIIPLITVLNDSDSDIRNASARTLGKMGTDLFDDIAFYSKSDDPVIRRKICDVFGIMGDSRAVVSLNNLIIDQDVYVRRRAAQALVMVGDMRSVETLIRSLNDPEYKVRARAAEALGKIKDKKAVNPLINALKDHKSRVRKASIVALGEIGETQAINPIKLLLNDKRAEVRDLAATTLSNKFKVEPSFENTHNTPQNEDIVDSVMDIGKDVINNIFGTPNNKKAHKTCTCPNCSSVIDPDTKFCAKCGERLKISEAEDLGPENLICNSCGEPNLNYAVYCAYCGNKISKNN